MSKKLLLADDSITIQKVIEITFANQDFDLTLVGNGDDAFEKAKNDPPDIILADIIMPGKNGYELCRAIKKIQNLSHIPILLLVGSFEPFDEEKARAIGADGWIAKPFETQALISKVQHLLENAPPPGLVSSSPADQGEEAFAPDMDSADGGLSFSFDLDEVSAPAAAAGTFSGGEEPAPPGGDLASDFGAAFSDRDSAEESREDFPALNREESVAEFSPADEEPAENFSGDSLLEGPMAPPPEDDHQDFQTEPSFEFSLATEEEKSSGEKEEATTFASLEKGSEPLTGYGEPADQPSGPEEADVFSSPLSFADEEDVLFLSEEDIVVEEEEPMGAVEAAPLADAGAELASEEFSYTPSEALEEKIPLAAEEPPGEAEMAFEFDGSPEVAERDQQGQLSEATSMPVMAAVSAAEEAPLPVVEEDLVLAEEPLKAADETEQDTGEFSFAPLATAAEETPFGLEEPLGEAETVFEIDGSPEAEESDQEEVIFSFDPMAGEEPPEKETSVAAESASEQVAFDLIEEVPADMQGAALSIVEVDEEAGGEEVATGEIGPPPVSAAAVEEKIASLSDGELYAIVERVAKDRLDRMALEILERIAWEVVPNMSESLIKEEIRKIKELRH
ncbi:MAG: response regulator [Deltaproteobacteria bacterium]|nr:response regulator [Deltaproteobacteria bacterium]